MRLCADVGGSFIDLGLVSEGGGIIDRRHAPTPAHDWQAFVAVFRDALVDYRTSLDPDAPLCVAVAGTIAPGTGIVTSANVACLYGRPLATDLSAALDRPVAILNDADAFALAEARMGAGRGHRRVFGVILGTGVGGGLIEDGAPLVGADGVGGEWGHGPLLIDSPLHPGSVPVFACGCGRSGCLDTVGSARGLERLHRFLHGAEASSTAITDAWLDGDAQADATVRYFVRIVSGPLAAFLNTFPATIVPVGGGLSNCRALVDALDVQVREGMLSPPAQPVVVAGTLGDRAGLLGAALCSGMALRVEAFAQI